MKKDDLHLDIVYEDIFYIEKIKEENEYEERPRLYVEDIYYEKSIKENNKKEPRRVIIIDI